MYAVIVMDDFCNDTSACTEINSIIPQGVMEFNQMLEITNPFSNRIIIHHTTGHEQYSLLDVSDRNVWSGQQIEDVNFSYLNSGAYILSSSNLSDSKVYFIA
ncbi:MAG: hypothetical protein JSS80_10025 [Bacteroidetes bacterium]|nr:hypothetical protein [Bacteroidota bacterium]